MSYASMYALAFDETFRARVVAACKVRALNMGAAAIAADRALADAIIRASADALPMVSAVAARFPDETNGAAPTDEEIGAAVESVWTQYALTLYPPAPAEPGGGPKPGTLPVLPESQQGEPVNG